MMKGFINIDKDELFIVKDEVNASSKRIVTHYLNSFYENDIDAILANYTIMLQGVLRIA